MRFHVDQTMIASNGCSNLRLGCSKASDTLKIQNTVQASLQTSSAPCSARRAQRRAGSNGTRGNRWDPDIGFAPAWNCWSPTGKDMRRWCEPKSTPTTALMRGGHLSLRRPFSEKSFHFITEVIIYCGCSSNIIQCSLFNLDLDLETSS